MHSSFDLSLLGLLALLLVVGFLFLFVFKKSDGKQKKLSRKPGDRWWEYEGWTILIALLLRITRSSAEKKQGKKEDGWWKAEGWGETIKTFGWAIVLALVFRSFLFEPFHIPSKSMVPTLLIGDFVIVEKYSYGYGRYSFPFGFKLFEGRKWYTEPKRGDIVVFRVPQNRDHDIFIKRITGLPGDRLQMRDGVLYINGKALPQEPIGNFIEKETGMEIPELVETLPEGMKYFVLNAESEGTFDNTDEFIVPEGNFFMMGDNRDNSADSRAGLGYVPMENLIGRAQIILFSSRGWLVNPLAWRYDRFFTKLYD